MNKILLLMKHSGKFLNDNSTLILSGLSAVGVVATAVVASKDTLKAQKLVYEHINETYENPENVLVRDLEKKELAKVVWRAYVPTILVTSSTVCGIVFAQKINMSRLGTLASAYAVLETSTRDYREKVIEAFGEKKEEGVRSKLDKEEIEKNPPVDKSIIRTEYGDTLIYDITSGRYFKSSLEHIKSVVNELNYKMLHGEDWISLNVFYAELGLDWSSMGDDFGWTSDHLLEVRYTAQLSKNDEPCIVLNYDTVYRRDYGWLM